MKKNLVITIGRECGSSGRAIGRKLAESCGNHAMIKSFDWQRRTAVSVKSFLRRMMRNQPTATYIHWYGHLFDGYNTSAYMDMPINHKIFLAQFDTIKKLADEESCVIVGRCADCALADYPNVVSVFICADEEVKIQELMKRHNITRDKAKDVMIKTDKQRSGYYNYYSSKRWGSSKSYNLCINSSVVGIDRQPQKLLRTRQRNKNFLR